MMSSAHSPPRRTWRRLGPTCARTFKQLGNRVTWMIGVNWTLTLLILGKLLLFKA